MVLEAPTTNNIKVFKALAKTKAFFVCLFVFMRQMLSKKEQAKGLFLLYEKAYEKYFVIPNTDDMSSFADTPF